ncbi:autotransporter assembly complex protein TamA [Larsenimonas rhizosphaerae]|uniref:Translocation and assembly module subunit TamA n=1 Tax=Larsenimonas rhizosphaerae TaxID=2944682 RepID=A0AA41ZDP0_9GAMM|nr:autotransporter assembly complex family protein [Larsenimonas rhizosphaerae]MCM2130685.1 autotransporter assembly complex protein TamA [Larsenimonas rhizosphaerae]MCX2523389.1 autotransporter assembly complex protein TamA [Larsenimonas rhizosphaerae]
MTRMSWGKMQRPIMAVLCCLSTSQALAIDTTVKGIGGQPATNIKNFLSTVSIGEQARLGAWQGEIEQKVEQALHAYGYYSSDLDINIESRNHVIVTVTPGPQVRLDHLWLEVRGAAKDDAPFEKAIDESTLKARKGKPLHHADYAALKTRLQNLALQRGYFDANFTAHRLEIRPWADEANVTLILDSGPRYRYGDITIKGNQVDETRLRNMLPFKTGDYYLTSELATYNQRLSQAGWFKGIAVTPRLSTANEDTVIVDKGSKGTLPPAADNTPRQVTPPEKAVVPIDVNLLPADRHQFEIGGGYATDVGPRLQFNWKQPWVNRRGDSWNNSLYLSAPKTVFEGVYSIPLANPIKDSYEITYGLKKLDNEDTRSFESSAAFARLWKFDNGWDQRLYLRATREDFTQADQDETVYLLVPGVSWSRTAVDNQRFPMHGNRQDALFEASDTAWGSDARFVRTRLNSQWITSLGNNNRFVGRATVGATATDTFDKIPPSLRFFAGGDNSLRGYDFESISPENDDGELLGGQHLLTTTAEYQRRVTGDWWAATFIDAGNAFDAWWPEEIKKSAGIGVRWISPVGPIRFDLAKPIGDDDNNSLHIHFAIGPEF